MQQKSQLYDKIQYLHLNNINISIVYLFYLSQCVHWNKYVSQ